MRAFGMHVTFGPFFSLKNVSHVKIQNEGRFSAARMSFQWSNFSRPIFSPTVSTVGCVCWRSAVGKSTKSVHASHAHTHTHTHCRRYAAERRARRYAPTSGVALGWAGRAVGPCGLDPEFQAENFFARVRNF